MNRSKPFVVILAAILCMTCREVDDVTPNQAPVADAGESQTITAGQPLSLNGSSSSDPDGDDLAYTWTFLEKPPTSKAQIDPFDSVATMFTPDRSGVYRIRLEVTDNIESDADTIEVTALQPNGAPMANAGNDGKANLGTQYQLSGSGTDPEQDPLTFNWTLIGKPSGSVAAIQNPSSQNATFTVDKHGSYTALLEVSDGSFTSTDEVVITTNSVNITGINPTSGPFGTTVKITGTNFSNVAAENTVTFNGVSATVTSASFTGLEVTVPKGAGTGVVSVTVNGVTDNGPTFTYTLTPVVSTVVQFNAPFYLTTDVSGNVYISDYNSHVIRRLTPAGDLTIIAGNGQAGYLDNKNPLLAQFNHPAGIVIDANNNLYVADNGNHCIRRISLSTGDVSTFAGFPQAGYNDAVGGQAQFNTPIGLGIDPSGNLYVGDMGNYRIRRISTGGSVSTLAGNGQQGFADGNGMAAQFSTIAGVTVDANYNIYVADGFNHRIRKVDGQGTVTTLAGNGTAGFVNGTGSAARLNTPYGVGCDASGNVYVADFSNHSVRRITPQGTVTTVAGNGTSGFADGASSTARFNQPTGVTVGADGKIYIADFGNQRIRLIRYE